MFLKSIWDSAFQYLESYEEKKIWSGEKTGGHFMNSFLTPWPQGISLDVQSGGSDVQSGGSCTWQDITGYTACGKW